MTGQTHHSDTSFYPASTKDISTAKHISPLKDTVTGYDIPGGLELEWEGDRRDNQGRAGAKLVVEKLGQTVGEGGLMEKVDVLQEIPYVIRKGLAAATGAKPFIYQVGFFQPYKDGST